MPHQPQVNQFFHLAPSLHEVGVQVRFRILAAGSHITTGRVEVGEGPVHQVEIEVVNLKSANDCLQERITSFSPGLSFHNLEVIHTCSRRMEVRQTFWKRISNLRFIAIHRGAIKMTVSNCGGALHSSRHLACYNMVRTKRPQADGGHPGTCVQNSLGYKRRINQHPVHHRPVMNLHAADLIPLQELPSAPSLFDKNCVHMAQER
jgi:hypothetical protein